MIKYGRHPPPPPQLVLGPILLGDECPLFAMKKHKDKLDPVFPYNTDEGEVVGRTTTNCFSQSLSQNELVFRYM